jgi:hypothetical protein
LKALPTLGGRRSVWALGLLSASEAAP